MRISDWSSDVCSSDLASHRSARAQGKARGPGQRLQPVARAARHLRDPGDRVSRRRCGRDKQAARPDHRRFPEDRSDEHTSELPSLMRISYAVFCLTIKDTVRSAPQTPHLYRDIRISNFNLYINTHIIEL